MDQAPVREDARKAGRPYLIAFVVGSLIMAFVVLRKARTEFEWVYVLSARNFLNGQGLYQLKVPPFRSYTYPPFMAIMSIPFALMSRSAARVSWFLVNLGCFVMIWRGTWRLTGGGRPEENDPRKEHLVAVLGLVCALPYLQSGIAHQQTDLLITALLTVGCLYLTRSRDALAGMSIGLAAGMKCTPFLWAPYLAWKGRWKAAILVPAVAVSINLLPDCIRRADGGVSWLGAWIDQFLRPMGRADYVPGRWFAWILDNQSLSGTFGRWATTRCVGEPGGLAIVARATSWSAQSLRPLVFGVEGILLLVTWYALRRGRAAGGGDTLREPTEFSVVLLLMLLLSPMSSRPHFAMTLLPALCLARLAVHEGRRVLFGPLAVTALTAILSLPFWGASMGKLTMWCGVLTWGTFSLLAGCLYALAVAERNRPEQTPQSGSRRGTVSQQGSAHGGPQVRSE